MKENIRKKLKKSRVKKGEENSEVGLDCISSGSWKDMNKKKKTHRKGNKKKVKKKGKGQLDCMKANDEKKIEKVNKRGT